MGLEDMKKMRPSGRRLSEVLNDAERQFYEAHGYRLTVEEAIRLTDEAREEIRREKEMRDKKENN